jgi:hypothetical protein
MQQAVHLEQAPGVLLETIAMEELATTKSPLARFRHVVVHRNSGKARSNERMKKRREKATFRH